MKGQNGMKGQYEAAEESWSTDRRKDPATTRVVIPDSKVNRKDEQIFTDMAQGCVYGENREPAEDTSHRDEEPDKIETHRMMMENQQAPQETIQEIVHQNYYACEVKSEERVKSSMMKLANYTLNENEIIKTYLSPGTETNNSAMLLLARTLFSSNRYIFEFLNENGFFRPSSQNAVNALASDLLSHSRQLCDVLLRAERSSEVATKNMVVSCVNNFVSASNKLATVLEQDYVRKSATAKDNVLNNIMSTRNQISNSLLGVFSNVSKGTGGTDCFLADAQEFIHFLYSGLDKDKLLANQNSNKKLKPPQINPIKNPLFEFEDSINDASDILSTASSFLDFNESSLSVMFEEDERDARDSGLPETHLDAIFERMNLSIPNEHVEDDAGSTLELQSADGGYGPPEIPKLTAREKLRLVVLARSQARQEKKQKNLEQKKARRASKQQEQSDDSNNNNMDHRIWSKMSIIGRTSKSKTNQKDKQERNLSTKRILVEI